MVETNVRVERTRKRKTWMVNAVEARHHALLLAFATWVVSIVIAFGGSGRMSALGQLVGPDFVHFYTFGHLAREGRIAQAYDWQAFHASQVTFVPESAGAIYPPVYPPHAAVIFIPFSVLSFTDALRTWSAISILLYGGIVWVAWRSARTHLPDRVLVFAAAAGFPPFWQVVMNGQITVIVLGAFLLAWLALEHNRNFLAGCALGLLAIKPQFGLPFAAIVLVRRDWRMLGGAIASVALQALIVSLTLGSEAFLGYYSMLPSIVAHADALEPKAFQSHSIRSLTRLLPAWIGVPAWLLAATLVLWKTASSWSLDAPLTVRFGLAMVASVLVSPHLLVYDAAVLVLPLIWFAAWFVQHGNVTALQQFGALTYALFFAFLAPSAALIAF